MDKLFEPFFSLKKDGMGMGLAICRTIIEVHQGTIEGHLNPDQGMTFTITLPLADSA
jgi:signal transduction histidine kinase